MEHSPTKVLVAEESFRCGAKRTILEPTRVLLNCLRCNFAPRIIDVPKLEGVSTTLEIDYAVSDYLRKNCGPMQER